MNKIQVTMSIDMKRHHITIDERTINKHHIVIEKKQNFVDCRHLAVQMLSDEFKMYDARVDGIATLGPRCSFNDNNTKTIVARAGIKRITIEFEDDLEPIFISKEDFEDGKTTH